MFIFSFKSVLGGEVDHPLRLDFQRFLSAPSNARSVVITTGRSEGGAMKRGVGGGSGELEGRAVRLGDDSVEWGFGNRGRYWPGGGRGWDCGRGLSP